MTRRRRRSRPETPAKLEDKPKSQGESYAEGAGKVVEGLLGTKGGQEVQERITSSKPLTGAIAAGMLAAGKEVPIPLGKGVTLGVKVDGLTEGKVNSAGVTLSFGGRGSTRRTTAKPVIDRDSEKLMESIRAQTEVQPQQTPAIRPLWVPELVPQLPPPTPAGQGWMFNPLVRGASVEGGQPTQQPPQPDPVKKEDEVGRRRPRPTQAPSEGQYDTSGVDAATRGGGRALDPALRHSMEARFGYDFSSVRVHDDPQAASAAAGVDAAAFTVGEHIVFGSGRFDPSSPGAATSSRTSSPTSSSSAGAPPRARPGHRRECSGAASGRTWRSSSAPRAAGSTQSSGYLTAITRANAHDGSYDADNKARAVVRKWKAGSAGWELTGQQMALLIDEMIDGPTLDDDEDAILDLLELATADELLVVFRDPGKRYASLNDDFHGAQQDRLDDLVARRFTGGGKALAQGRVEVAGPAIPAGSPSFASDAAQFDARFEDDYYGQDPASVVARLSPADRVKARDHVLRTTRPRWNAELDAVDPPAGRGGGPGQAGRAPEEGGHAQASRAGARPLNRRHASSAAASVGRRGAGRHGTRAR